MAHSKDYEAARKRVQARMGFYAHLSVYAAVILFLAVIDLLTSPGITWVQWPAIGWGIAIALHAVFALVMPGQFRITAEMIETEMAKSQYRSDS